jgi:hypothetical protein
MEINYTADAFASLIKLVNWIEDKNTAGAGLRWLNKYEYFLLENLSRPEEIKLCHNITFKQLNLRCIYFNDWVIAFSAHANNILIEALLHKSRIAD